MQFEGNALRPESAVHRIGTGAGGAVVGPLFRFGSNCPTREGGGPPNSNARAG